MLQQQLRQKDEDIAAKAVEIVELKERVAELEKLKQDQQQLLSLKDSELAAAQQRLAEANKAAAAGYQDLFKKQLAIFEETTAEAQKAMKDFDATRIDPEKAKAQGELAKAAFEKALSNMQALAEGAQKANKEAYEIVSARIQESLVELRDMATKTRG